jgi:signal transduction histidine kinase
MAPIAKRTRAPWLAASAGRALLETLLIAAALAALSLTLIPFEHTAGLLPLRVGPSMVLLAGPCCALWCAVRLRVRPGAPWRQLPLELLIGLPLGLAPTALVVATFSALDAQGGERAAAVHALLGRIAPAWAIPVLLALFALEFVVLRLGVRLWLVWDRLRRRHLRWALTHAHLTVVVLASGALAALLLLNDLDKIGSVLAIVPVLFVLSIVTGIALALVLAPSAVFSYLFARPTTERVERLAAATDALRAGDYGVRVAVTGEDEIARLQANFNAMAADLERAVRDLQVERDTVAGLLRARRELVAGVSHELRTPVATLRGYLDSALAHWDGRPAPMLHRDLEVMERETVRLQGLIDDLFSLSRAEVGRLELRRAPTDLAAVARAAVAAVAPLAWQSHRVEVVAEAGGSVPAALADAGRVEQALANLLHNAVRHTPPGGIVAVTASAEGAAVALRVRDTGEGIAAADLPHIWERFYRGGGARARDGEGSGLGLALVKELVEAMGGYVAAESTPGAGSCFTIRLPRVAEEPGRERATMVRAGDGRIEDHAMRLRS